MSKKRQRWRGCLSNRGKLWRKGKVLA